jgi:hypothetical protein
MSAVSTKWVPDEIVKKENMKEEKGSVLGRQAKSYCNSCSIHGLTYIAEDGRPISERQDGAKKNQINNRVEAFP